MNLINILKRKNNSPPLPSTLNVLILGQSNAGDRNTTNTLTSPYVGIARNYPNVNYISYSNTLTQYSGTTTLGTYDKHLGSASFGVELGFLSVFQNKYFNVIKYYYGSKALKQQTGDTDFSPNSVNELYDVGIFKGDNTGFCEQICSANNLIPDIVIWIQSEQDAVINSQTYLTDLQSLTSQLRSDFNNPNLTFIYNKLHEDFYFYDSAEHAEPGKAYVRSAQDSFNNNDTNKLIIFDDLSIGDVFNVHFDANCSAELGIRMGNFAKIKYGD